MRGTSLPYLAGIMVSMLFGFSFMFTKDALEVLAPVELLGFRFVLAAAVLTLLRLMGVIKVDLRRANPLPLLVVAFFQPVLYFLFETTGIKLTTASEAGLMMGLIPVAVVLLEIPFFRTVPSLRRLGCILLSVTGVAFIVLMQGGPRFGGNRLGTLFLLGAVISAALYNIMSKKSSVSYTPVEITYIMMWTGALLFGGLALWGRLGRGGPAALLRQLAEPGVLPAVVYLGVLSSVVAFFLVNFMLSRLAASHTATFANLTTVVAVLAGVLIRGEAFVWFQGAGAAMIILGVWGTTYFGQERRLMVPETVGLVKESSK